jgi:hypothetical protein
MSQIDVETEHPVSVIDEDGLFHPSCCPGLLAMLSSRQMSIGLNVSDLYAQRPRSFIEPDTVGVYQDMRTQYTLCRKQGQFCGGSILYSLP